MLQVALVLLPGAEEVQVVSVLSEVFASQL
jgi:hypothetical protein